MRKITFLSFSFWLMMSAAIFSPTVTGTVSSHRSIIEVENYIGMADGKTPILGKGLAVNIKGEPLSHANVRIQSNNSHIQVIHPQQTQSDGSFQFMIISQAPGVATISAWINDIPLLSDINVAFYLDASSLSIGNTGVGNYLKTQFFENDSDAELAEFTFEGIPDNITAGESLSFQIVARDASGNPLPNYLGTVRFSSSDDNSQLPADYTFDEADQGSHFFSLSTSFVNSGEHTLVVHDLGDFRLKGELKIQVGKEEEVDLEPKITISTPTPGTYSLARLTISGNTQSVDRVNLYDGSTLLIEGLPVGIENNDYLFETPALAEGTHIFRATSIDGRVTSNEVQVFIDRSSPQLVSIEINPQGKVAPSTPININISSDEVLARASCILDGNSVSLLPSSESFTGSIPAPIECGEYPIDCVVADLLGNESVHNNAGIIDVCIPEAESEDIFVEPPAEVEPTPNLPPLAVSNLRTEPGDERVTLYWSPAKDDGTIIQYRILYGLTSDDLREENITPDDRTRWYVDNLTNGVTYYFQVIAIDNHQTEGIPTEIVPGTPQGKEPLYPSAIELDKTGTGIYYWILSGALGGIILMGTFIFSRK